MARRNRTDLRALRNMIDEAHQLLETTELPANFSAPPLSWPIIS
jgi:hypothetical protein